MNDLHYQNAVRAHQAGKLTEAARLYAEILRADPRHFPALFSLGYLHYQTGRFEDAQRLLGEALRLNINSPDALFLRGLALQQLNRAAEALQCFDRALAAKPDFPEAHSAREAALKSLGRQSSPVAAVQASTVPESAAAAYVRACTLAQGNQLEQSLAEFDRAIAIAPHFIEALCNRGAVLLALQRPEGAVQSFDAALQINPSFFEALNNRGNALSELGRFEEAVASYDRALAARPNAFELLLNRGNALLSARRAEEALTSYEQALTSQPGNAPALKGRANALFELGRFEEAIGGFEAALARDPAQPYALGDLVFSKLQCCDWRNLREERAHIIAAVKRGDAVINPFEFLALPAGPDEQRACAAIWVGEKYPPAAAPLYRGESYGHDRIRVGYLSANFHNHAAGQAIAGILEKHDRARFEIFGVSWGPDDGSELRTRIARACDRFVDASRHSDAEVARLMRQMEIDIAVDLMGFTAEHRTSILAARAAPIQVNYLGYAGTMAAPYVDYLIADSVVIPDDERVCYSEKVVTLPGSYLPVDDTRVVGPALSRSLAGLPEDAFVFVCFNNSYKFAPEVFDIWMRLLQRTEGSVLWLSRVNTAAARNLAREASSRGIDPSRLIFAPFVANASDHLARVASADLFLDTLPYNAHATAVDALLAGVPVITCKGNSFAGRVGASLLHAAGMPELVTNSLEAYADLALQLASDRERLATVKEKLTRARHSQVLFDTSRFTKDLEQVYLEMQQRARTASTS